MKLFYNLLMMGGFCAAMLGASVNASAEGYYPVNPDKNAQTTSNQANRQLNGFTLISPSYGRQEVSVENPEARIVYNDFTDKVFLAKAGETLSFIPGFGGTWMHSYLYIDRDNNGQFEPNLTVSGNKYVLNSNSELVSWSILSVNGSSSGYNTIGEKWDLSSYSNIDLPDYTLPADMAPGMYRMRLKIDWNNQDPAGSGTILNDGGYFADMLLAVSDGSDVNVSVTDVENGSIVGENGEVIPSTLPFGVAYKAKAVAADGYDCYAVKVTHGYNLEGDEYYHDNRMHKVNTFTVYDFDRNGVVTIPAEMMDGDVKIEGVFVEAGSFEKPLWLTYNLVVDDNVVAEKEFTAQVGDAYPTFDWGIEASTDYYEIEYPEGVISENDGEEPIQINLLQALPFVSSAKVDPTTIWYNLTIAESKYYLSHVAGADYISLTSTATPDENDEYAQWAFIGNVYEGFKIYNKAAGNDYILSSSTNMTGAEGGSTYPIMMAEESLPTNYNTYWIPKKNSTNFASNGFFLQQKGISTNIMNKRGNYLAYWTGGADNGSTFTAERVTPEFAGVDVVEADQEFDYSDAVYYTLQGIRVEASQLVPGIYVAKNGSKTVKVLVK